MKPARRSDEVEADSPIEVPKSGKKKGGLRWKSVTVRSWESEQGTHTKSGKSAMAPPNSRRTKRESRKKLL